MQTVDVEKDVQVLENRLNQALNSDRPTLVMFYEPNDPRCREEWPAVEATATRMSGKSHIFCVDVTENPNLKTKYHIHAYPTFILFSDGQEAWRATGRTPQSELEDMINRFA